MDNFQMIMDRLDLIEQENKERLLSLETGIKEHFQMCQEICITKIKIVDEKAEKAHIRLNRHKESLDTLCAHKNREIGFRRAISIGMGAIGIVLAYLGLKN